MAADHPLTLTVEQAGKVLGVGRSTAYELVRSGELKAIRLRRRIVVPVAHLTETLGVFHAHAQVRTAADQGSHARQPDLLPELWNLPVHFEQWPVPDRPTCVVLIPDRKSRRCCEGFEAVRTGPDPIDEYGHGRHSRRWWSPATRGSTRTRMF